MRAVMLIENTAVRPELDAEHGLSLYIEANGRRLLFDMGQSDRFLGNAQKLGVDLAGVEIAILSHGHYDHGGGLRRFLSCNTAAPVYACPTAFERHFAGDEREIGLEPPDTWAERLVPVRDGMKIAEGISLCTCNARSRVYPSSDRGLYRLENGRRVQDRFEHEQYLLIEEGGKRIVVSGCAHKGVLNILSWLRPDVLIGGFHFMKLDTQGQELRDAAAALKRFATVYYTCHCTGVEQYRFLKGELGGQLHYMGGGAWVNL